MKTHIRHLIILLLCWVFASIAEAQITPTYTMNLTKGHIKFTDTQVTYVDNGGTARTITRASGDIYEIYTSAQSTKVISVGTKSTPVTTNTVILLSGVDIKPNTAADKDWPAIYVNTASDTVTIVLKDGTTNTIHGYANSTGGFAHAALEKEVGTQGTLRVVCETGFARTNHRHDCAEDDDCGTLVATGHKDQASSVNIYYCGAGIGSPGCLTGGTYDEDDPPDPSVPNNESTLYNLLISGGKITATGAGDGNIGAAGIGVSASGPTTKKMGYNLDNLRIEGGRITARPGGAAGACIGGSYHCGYVTVNVTGGYIDADRADGTGNKAPRGAGVGGGGGGSGTNAHFGATVNISGGEIHAKSRNGAAIGSGAGGSSGSGTPGIVNITGGTIYASTYGYGAAIGTGGSSGTGHSGNATVSISGNPTITAYSDLGADIGGGGTDSSDSGAYGGNGNVTISGGDITTTGGGIGGGKANAGFGGEAVINISGGTITTTSIGGGYSETNDGGYAAVNVSGTADITVSGGIGGGNSTKNTTTRNGGSANIVVTGGSLVADGKIGGGNSAGSGAGGDASIYVTGGILDCASIGGGDSNTGTPGSVTATVNPTTNPLGAGVYIAGSSKITVKAGSIGGGNNTTGGLGYATAYINATHSESTIQGQFILTNSVSSRHCFFQLVDGTIDNTLLGTGKYTRLKDEGGAIYMTDPYGAEITIDGGNIQKCTGTYGGAIYMSAGTFTMNDGTIGGASLSVGNVASISGGGLYMAGGSFTMNGGAIKYNQAMGEAGTNGGGGIFIATGGTASVHGGSICGNQAPSENAKGGGLYIDPGAGITTTIDNTEGTTDISDNIAGYNGGAVYVQNGSLNVDTVSMHGNQVGRHGGALFLNKGACTLTNATIGAEGRPNTASNQGGGIYVKEGNFTMNGGSFNYNQSASGGGGAAIKAGVSVINGGSLNYNKTTSGPGGGVYASGGNVSIYSVSLVGNEASGRGGGLYASGASTVVTIDRLNASAANALFDSNKANYGGGIYAEANSVTVANASFTDNIANNQGGGLYVKGPVTLNSGTSLVKNTAKSGGAVYVDDGVFTMNSGVTIGGSAANANTSTGTSTGEGGGGIYITGSDGDACLSVVNVNGGEISYNTAARYGGGLYVDKTKPSTQPAPYGTNFDGSTNTVTLSHNSALRGGGAFVNGGLLSLSGANVTVSNNTADKCGGGFYMNNGTMNVTLATIRDNTAEDEHGGGFYLGSGSFTLEGATVSGNQALDGDGGGLYVGDGTITISKNVSVIPSFTANAANNGGVLYMGGGTLTLNEGILGGSHANRNKATTSGGAIYADGGTVDITYTSESVGKISYNTAGVSGGGLYVSSTGTLNMTGNVTLSKNHVPANRHGGGVYLAGVVQIGSSTAKEILVQDNFAYGTIDTDPGDITINETNRNNVFLHDPMVSSGSRKTSVITVIENGLTTSTRVGFSVPRNYVPVIYCAPSVTSGNYLKSFLENPPAKTGAMFGTVFDDADLYQTVYNVNAPYHPDYVFLSGDAWVEIITSLAQAGSGFVVDAVNNTVTVSTPEALAYLISYVNGLNDQIGTPHLGINIKLGADINIGAFTWTPIAGRNAGNDLVFTGTFDGQGHTISNLYGMLLPTWSGDGQGLFGILGSTAEVKNVCLTGAILTTRDVTGAFYLGGIAKEMTAGATVSDCVVESTIETASATAIAGGLVGRVSGGTIRNCVAVPDIKGYQMGGIVGSNAGDIYNSFASASFDYQGTSEYFGGLVGVNTGRVENCYALVRGTAPSSTYFGYLAGDNTSTTDKGLYYSYSSNSQYVATETGTTAGNQTGLGTFTATAADAYNYKSHDNQVTASGNTYVPGSASPNKQLVKTLNNWVKAKGSPYAKWLRPTTQVINGDYPLLRLPAYNAVAATSGEASLAYGDINGYLTDYTLATQAICLYGSKADVNTNSGSSAPLYIDQDAVITQTGDLHAYVGVTLDNTAGENGGGANPSLVETTDYIDWHFFSSVLSNAPIGLAYPSGQSVYGVTPAQATFTAENAANGYFPTNLDSYYGEWDLYGYYEPDYHWVNYKRNSESHWHQDFTDIQINYTNHTIFQPGYGYMIALAEENYLQAYGTLNSHPDYTLPLTVSLDYTPSISGTTRQGHNLLGNPYQSYLDFNLFAQYNSGLWGGDESDAYYIIMDEDQSGYIYYEYDASVNPYTAPRYLHPHQGFMVVVGQTGLSAKFDDRMRNTTAAGVTFRDGQPSYPLVNLFAEDAKGNHDMVTVELGRPDKGGAPKQQALCASTGSLWCSYEGENYAIAFTQPGLNAANIRFASVEDAEYTMTWNTQNGEFSYLHLIDNITGADIDCLTTEKYEFTSRTTDYTSRFRLVFGYTGIEEPSVPEPVEGPTPFAYYANGEIHLVGADACDASLQIIDMTGRIIVSRDAARHVSTNGMVPGVYILRLTTDTGSRTQKIILE